MTADTRVLARARLLAIAAHCAAPAAFALTLIATGIARDALSAQVIIVPLLGVLAGALTYGVKRRHPARWPTTGALISSATAVVCAQFVYQFGVGGQRFFAFGGTGMVLLMLLGAATGWLLGRSARDALLDPPPSAVADTRYQLVFGIRGNEEKTHGALAGTLREADPGVQRARADHAHRHDRLDPAPEPRT